MSTAAQLASPWRRRPGGRWPVSLSVERADRHRVLTLLAAAGLGAGILLAVFGLPPVELHGPLYHLGVMCPFCGATRAVRLALLGEWGASLRYNPIGLPLVAGAAFLVVRAGIGVATRRWLTVRVHWSRPLLVGVVVAVAALWVNQQLHVELIGPR